MAVLEAAFEDAGQDPVDPSLLAQFGTYLANAYTDEGRFAEAEAVLAAVIKREPDLAPGNALRLDWAMARTYAEEGRLGIAETYTRRVLERLNGAEERSLVGRAHLLLAGVLIDLGRPEDAALHLELSEPLLDGQAETDLCRLSIDKAKLAMLHGDFDVAELNARQAPERTGATEPGHAGAAYTLLAEVEYERGNLEEARLLCRDAIGSLSGTVSPFYARQAYQLLSRVEEAAGNLQAALDAARATPSSLPTVTDH